VSCDGWRNISIALFDLGSECDGLVCINNGYFRIVGDPGAPLPWLVWAVCNLDQTHILQLSRIPDNRKDPPRRISANLEPL